MPIHLSRSDPYLLEEVTGRGGRIGKARILRAGERGFESMIESMTYKIDTCHFLARCSALLG